MKKLWKSGVALVLVCALMFTQFNTVNVFANTSVQAEESETKEQITVSVTVVGDSVHGTEAHTRFENWLVNYKVTVDKGATADDAFKKALESNGYSYEKNSWNFYYSCGYNLYIIYVLYFKKNAVDLVAIIAIIFLMIANWGVVLAVIGKFLTILMPFILGFFFACFINPLVKRVHSLLNRMKPGKGAKIKKAFSVIISYVVVIGVITVLLIYIIPQIKESIGELGNTIQDGYQYMITHQKELNEKIPFIGLGGGIEYIKEFAYKKIMSNGSEILPYVYHVSSSLLTTSYNVLMGLVISIYIILDMKKLKRSARKVVYALSPKKKEQEVWQTMKQCSHIFNGFLIGKMIDSLIIGILCLIAMSILKLPYALLLSLIVCITNMIPYFGPIIGAIPGVMIYLFIDIRYAFIFALMILILQQFDGLYLGPKILGDQTGIKPLWVIFGITVGGAYFGVMGMFLGVPVVAVIMYLLQLFLDKKLKKKNISTFDSK